MGAGSYHAVTGMLPPSGGLKEYRCGTVPYSLTITGTRPIVAMATWLYRASARRLAATCMGNSGLPTFCPLVSPTKKPSSSSEGIYLSAIVIPTNMDQTALYHM